MLKRLPRRYSIGFAFLAIGVVALAAVSIALRTGEQEQPEVSDPDPALSAGVGADLPTCPGGADCDNLAVDPVEADNSEVADPGQSESGPATDILPTATESAENSSPEEPASTASGTSPEEAEPAEDPSADDLAASGSWRIFTGDEFNQLFNRVELPNLAPPDDLPSITGDTAVDERIRQIAIDRGYRLRPMPADTSRLVVVEADRHRLQPEAAEAYRELRAAAAAEGLAIWLVSAYRSYDYQRPLFLRQVEAPYSDDAVFDRLKLVAIPGYSKHHTGYTIDLAEGQLIFGDFADSASYAWLSADNYQNAKRYGWIPSYPPDADRQGPDPEPWEFTYVGRQLLLAAPGS